MQYLFRVICDENEDFRRDLLINDDASFLELNQLLLDSCNYPDDQMTSFYLCDERWDRGTQITREDVNENTNGFESIRVMRSTLLREFCDRGEKRLEFVFDPFSDRSFCLFLREELPGYGAPEIRLAKGEAPPQILDNPLMPSTAPLVASEGLGLDWDQDFGWDTFNDDELDVEGYEISDDQY